MGTKKVEIDILGAAYPPPVAIEVKFCTGKRTHVPVGSAKFEVNRCNESPLRGEKPDLWPVSKFNTGSLPLCGIRPVKKTNTKFSHLQPLSLCDLPQTLHGDRVRRVYPKKCHSFFDPTYSFAYRVHGKIWPNLPASGISAITP